MIVATRGIAIVIKEKYDQRVTDLSVCERKKERIGFVVLKESSSFLMVVDVFLMRFSSFWHDLFLYRENTQIFHESNGSFKRERVFIARVNSSPSPA